MIGFSAVIKASLHFLPALQANIVCISQETQAVNLIQSIATLDGTLRTQTGVCSKPHDQSGFDSVKLTDQACFGNRTGGTCVYFERQH